MKLYRRLVEVRIAQQRVADARLHSAACSARLHRHVNTHPLTSVCIAASGGLLIGLVTRRHVGGLIELWYDPALRWLLHLLLVSVESR